MALPTRTADQYPSHAVSSSHWTRDDLLALFDRADWMTRQTRRTLSDLAPDRTVGLLFYQNSTRTLVGFQASSALIGSAYIGFADARTTRAGDFFQETLEDTVRVVACFADLLVLRHVDDDAADRAAAVSTVPVVNAGSGQRDHPTQGMIESWMMLRTLGDLADRRIGFVGDPDNRAIRSILQMVLRFRPAEIVFLMPPGAAVQADQIDHLNAAGIASRSVPTAADLLHCVDVVSMIPVHLPDFHVAADRARTAERVPRHLVFTEALLRTAGKGVTILHTGPRGDELPSEVDHLPNVRYFEAVRMGSYLRAALMHLLWQQT